MKSLNCRFCLRSSLLYGTCLNFTTMHKCQFFYLRLNIAKPYPPTCVSRLDEQTDWCFQESIVLLYDLWWQMNMKAFVSIRRKICWKSKNFVLGFYLFCNIRDSNHLDFTTVHKLYCWSSKMHWLSDNAVLWLKMNNNFSLFIPKIQHYPIINAF